MKRILYTLIGVMFSVGAGAQTTLQEKINSAEAGATITLDSDVNLTEQVEITGKEITIDLNGHKITYSGSEISSGILLVHNGAGLTINATNGGSINSGIAMAAIALTKKGDDASNPAILVVNGGTITGGNYGITGNGSRHNTEITINGGTITATVEKDNFGIYHPQNGKLTITGGDIKAYSAAIEMRAGELNISGGTFTATATEYLCNPNSNGTTTVGAALAIAQHTTKKDIKVSISGGTFTGAKAINESNPQANDPTPQVTMAITNGTFIGEISTTDVNNFISGGTFSEAVPEDYCAEDFKPQNNGDGTYGVTAKDYVAQIGDKKYESLTEGIEAAQNGEIVTLLADVNTEAQIKIAGKEITLDLNGKTIAYTGTTTLSSGVLLVHNGAGLTVNATGGGAVISGEKAYAAIAVTKAGDDASNPAKLVINGGNFEGYYYAIAGNGSRHNTEITINDGTFKGLANSPSTDDMGLAIFHPQEGKLTINGGEFEGPAAGVEIRAGELNISDGTFKATATTFKEAWNGSGSTVVGAAIAISQHSTNKDIKVNITGGTFEGIKAVYEVDLNTAAGDKSDNIDINIEGGNFKGAVASENVQNFISGGTFDNLVPEQYCAEGFIPKDNGDGTYGVKEGSFVARIGEQGYETIADAIKAATDGQTIVLLADINKSVTIPVGKTLTIDLNGKAISSSNITNLITNNGNLTVEDTATGGKVYNGKASGAAIKNNSADAVLTIKNGIIESASISSNSGTIMNQFGTVNVTGGEIIGAKYPIYTGSTAGKTAVLNVSGGKFTSNSSYAIYLAGGKADITGGTFYPADEFDDVYLYCGGLKAPESVSNNASATFTSAEEGYVYSLAGAVNGASAGETVTMQKDANLVAAVTFNKDITLNLNNHSITSPVTALKVTAGTLTIEGEGLVKGANPNASATSTDPYAAVWANGGNVIINGGTFDEGGVDGSGNSTIFINKAGTITINGGEFKNSATYGGKYWIFNIQDAVKETASIVAKGGKYHNFDPANNVNDGNPDNMGTNYVADGYISVKIATSPYDIYEVKEGQWVATIADEAIKKFRYTSLDEAIDDAKAVDKDITITLLTNAETTKENLPTNVTISANGKVLTMPSFVVLDGQAFTLPNITGAETYKVRTATYKRTNISDTEWGTVCLPFSLTNGNGADYYTYNNISGSKLTVDKTTETVDPNTPVVFLKTAGDLNINEENATVSLNKTPTLTNGALVGTYSSAASIPADGSIYFINGNQFHKAQVAVTVPAYRAYIKYTAPTSAAPRSLSIVVGGENNETGVETITVDGADVNAVYDMAGRKMQAPRKGMSIVKFANGKTVKLFVK